MTRTGADPPVPPYGRAWGEEERAVIRGVPRQGNFKPTPEIVERLMEGVQQSVARFRAAEAGFRRKHDLLRQLWRLADRKHPPVGQIRHRIASLPADLLSELEVRAGRDWHRVFHEDYL